MQNQQNHNQTMVIKIELKLYFDLHHTKDKQTGYSLSICIKNNNDDGDSNNNNNEIIIIIIIIIFIEGTQLPMAVLSGSLIKVTKVIN